MNNTPSSKEPIMNLIERISVIKKENKPIAAVVSFLTWILLGLLVVAMIFFVGGPKAFGATATQSGINQGVGQDISINTRLIRCDRNDPCARPKRLVRHFKHGDLGRVHGVNLAPSVQHTLLRKFKHKYAVTTRNGSSSTGAVSYVTPAFGTITPRAWLRKIKTGTTCRPIAGWVMNCTDDAPQPLSEAEAFALTCGSAAVFGFFGGGGWLGLGRGAGQCTWVWVIAHYAAD